mmetsp:Transcript_32905/g.55464  ORF Transcript_32905/g.55464 Transcript_32905/m.55464 type:complete len:432 (+) Transcript_32905:61-1356(+)
MNKIAVCYTRWAQKPYKYFRSFSVAADSYQKARAAINSEDLPPRDVSNDAKLKMYGLFKQIEMGPCNTPQPGFFDPVGRAKHDAWSSLGDMSKDAAMGKYVEVVTELFDGTIPDVGSPTASCGDASATEPAQAKRVRPLSVADVAFPQLQSNRTSLADLNLKATLAEECEDGIQHIILNRPQRGNSLNMQMWDELYMIFEALKRETAPKVIVLSGAGGNFSTGMDLSVFAEMQQVAMKETCEGRRREGLTRFIQFLQDAISLPEAAAVPVIAAVAGHCIGGAVDMITACDMRYCTRDATFCIKETDLAIVADIGTLQRLPGLIGHQQACELTYTGRTITGVEAEALGLVLKCFDTEAEMMTHVHEVAQEIASKSPITIRGVKRVLLHKRDHTVTESLEQVKMWNTAYLLSDDLMEAMRAAMSKEKPVYKGH